MRKWLVKSAVLMLPLLVGGIVPATCNITGVPGFGFVSISGEEDDDDDFWDDLDDLFDDDD
jgi:hypothetical protein